MSKKEIDFEPVVGLGDSRIALSIRPPGTWFDSPLFHVFVGGCGRGKHRTLASAKNALLKWALAECDGRIARAKAEHECYERERQKLLEHGLRPSRGGNQ